MLPFPGALESRRLVIRPAHPSMAEPVNSAIAASFPELHRWMPWAGTLPAVDETRTYLTVAKQQFDSGEDCPLIVFHKATGQCVGATGLHPRPADPAWREIGYWIHSDHAGRGLATEMVEALVAAAFGPLGLAGLQIKASERNVASQRVAEKAGFARAGIFDDGRVDPGGIGSRTVVFTRASGEQ